MDEEHEPTGPTPAPSGSAPAGHDPELPHKPADDREEVYFDGSPQLRAELGKLFLWAIIAAILISLPILWSKWISTAKHAMPLGVKIALILLGIAALLIPALVIRTIRYRISNYRIDYERGILSKQIDTIELWHVEDLSLHQTLLDRILRTGTITIISHDETNPHLVLMGVPNPRPLFELMKQRIIAVKRQRGVIKMDIG